MVCLPLLATDHAVETTTIFMITFIIVIVHASKSKWPQVVHTAADSANQLVHCWQTHLADKCSKHRGAAHYSYHCSDRGCSGRPARLKQKTNCYSFMNTVCTIMEEPWLYNQNNKVILENKASLKCPYNMLPLQAPFYTHTHTLAHKLTHTHTSTHVHSLSLSLFLSLSSISC